MPVFLGVAPREPIYPPVTASEIKFVLLPNDPLWDVKQAITDAIVDISNRQACSDAFKRQKDNLTIPYDVVKSGKLRFAGVMALNQSNAGEIFGWSADQVDKARNGFKPRWWHPIFGKPNTGEGVWAGIPTIVFNATADFQALGGPREVVTHAFIHVGGEPGDPKDTHDLVKYGPYREIIDACK